MLLKEGAFLRYAVALSYLPCLALATSDNGRAYFAALEMNACPELCQVSGDNPSNWTNYHDMDKLFSCNQEPKLLDFAIRTPLSDPEMPTVIRACTTFRGETVEAEIFEAQYESSIVGTSENLGIETQVDLLMAWSPTSDPVIAPQIATAAKEIQVSLFSEMVEESSATTLFAHYGNSAVGVFVGSRINNRGVSLNILQQFIDHVLDDRSVISKTFLVQYCSDSLGSDYTIGIIGDTSGGVSAISTVQSAVKEWSEAKCVTGLQQNGKFGNSTIWTSSLLPSSNSTFLSNSTTSVSEHSFRTLKSRADCRTVQVISGDRCDLLAQRCGISGPDFTALHSSDSTFCSTLKPGQHVCCSSGTLPNLAPKPNPDGSCASYVVKSGDWCDKIASENSLTIAKLESLNKNIWGWSGCSRLFTGINMCLSSGDPPMPETIANSVCGPQKPGTIQGPKGTNLSEMNPCPLNTCCNVWGQCGTTSDFCTISSLGPPGTSEPGKSGCISNCGTKITNNGVPPKEFISIGYFEGWNKERSCLTMDVTQIGSSVTHIHFAFADVTANFQVSVSKVQEQFDKFVKMNGKKRILAFGGWTASTDPSSYNIFREGVKPGNREILAKNLADFIKSNNLDGIDLDWEYPGAPDIPGIPSADPIDGPNYLELLKLIRSQLPNKSLSIAAPASFWYLKPFPIEEIGKVVDYIVYMTYDLHGQWDYGSKWSSPGCPNGDCLRSHINITETQNALVMITKAGVPSNKIIVGITSYGRSFRMTTPGCDGPSCTYTGPLSGAKPGRCTGTSGYISNAEIKEIIANNPSARTFADGTSSNILVYDDVEWVAYMDDNNKAARTSAYRALNFGGVTDWAVDLDSFMPEVPKPGNGGGVPALPSTEGWKWPAINCQHQGMNDAKKEASWRWDQLLTDSAWEAAMFDFKSRPKETPAGGRELSFSAHVSAFFDGPPGMQCQLLVTNNLCHSPLQCWEGDDTGPAASFILNSFVGMSSMTHNFYESLNDAQGTLGAGKIIDKFISDFSPAEQSQLWKNIMFNFMNLAFGMAAAPVFNTFLKSSSYFLTRPKAFDTLKDDTYAMLVFAVSSAKDSAQPSVTSDKIHEVVDAYFSIYKTSLTIANKEIFSGSDKSIEFLSRVIDDGKIMDADAASSAIDAERRTLTTLYAYLLPHVWRSKNFYPVLIDVDGPCTDVGKGNYKWTTASDAIKAGVCVDGKLYYLMAINGWDRSCTSNKSGEICHFRKIPLPPGLSKLDPGSYWGITKTDIAKSAIAYYNDKGGNRRDASVPDITDPDEFNKMYAFIGVDVDAGAPAADKKNPSQTPGLVDIPICKAEEVTNNWKKITAGANIDWPAFPCNRA